MTDGLQIRLLGQLSVSRNGDSVPLPASRKVRALLAYLSVNEGVARSALCDLFWEVPNDPRGELRWCLSKVRSVVDADSRRVETSNDRIVLNVSDCFVDALAIDRALKPGVALLDVESLRTICDMFGGEFLEGLQLSGSARFNSWLLTQRHRYKAAQLAVLGRLCDLLERGSEEHFHRLHTWLQVSPFDRHAHEALMTALAEKGRVPDAEAHLATAIRQFEAEGLDWLALREAWRAIRARSTTSAVTVSTATAVTAAPSTIQITSTQGLQSRAVLPSQRRASIAVMPFTDRAVNGVRGGLADGLADDIITRLAKLRTYFVIARGTMFALGERNIGKQEAGQILNVDYLVSGVVSRHPQHLAVSVELVDTRNGRIQWAEDFTCDLQDQCAGLSNVGDRIVGAVAEEIEGAERNRAVLKSPSSLDAWEAYHRGLWHMYRFSSEDNAQAEHFFREAVRLDPTFARAHAGQSFTHFQNAFLNLQGDTEQQIDMAYQTAGLSLMADDRDPAAHWAMGRAMWLRGQQDESLLELSRSVELSPNFSLGHYMRGFVQSQSGDPLAALESVDYSQTLSPFDPMQFAMLATKAVAHIRLGNYDEAVSWALKAIARPNAHKHISSIAVHCLAAANRLDEARAIAALIRRGDSNYGVDNFLAAFRCDPDTADLFRRSAQRIGFG